MKLWKPCEHCYLKDKYCENTEREQPCIPVQEYLESSSEIKRLQILLGVSEKKLDIVVKALKEYENKQNWDKKGISFMKYNKGYILAKKALKEIDLVGTSTKGE